jgi:hypothetical protein
MHSGALTVQDDGTLTVVPRPGEDTTAFGRGPIFPVNR